MVVIFEKNFLVVYYITKLCLIKFIYFDRFLVVYYITKYV